jgi:hypothetical protein
VLVGLLGSGTEEEYCVCLVGEGRASVVAMVGLVIGGSIGLGVGLVLAVGFVHLFSERL